MIILELSQDNHKLARAEAESLCGRGETIGRYLLVNAGDFSKLAFTHSALKSILVCKRSESDRFWSVNWPGIIKGSYAVQGAHAKTVKVLAKAIWEKLLVPRVNLKNPNTCIVIHEHGEYFLIGKLLWRNKKSYMERRAHKRPEHHPTSLHPKIARACINLLGGCRTILDPFCGTGGILIEAGILGKKCVGYDISQKMLDMAEKNLAHYHVQARLLKRDALLPDRRYKYIVTDLPYGKNTKDIPKDLYLRFLHQLRIKKAVICFPNKVPGMPDNLIIENQFSIYIHKNLEKKIIVVRSS